MSHLSIVAKNTHSMGDHYTQTGLASIKPYALRHIMFKIMPV